MDPWRPSHSLATAHSVSVWLLTAAAAAGAYFLAASTGGIPIRPATVASSVVGMVFWLAAAGWPDWLSQGLRRIRHDEVPQDDDGARARLIVTAAVASGIAVATVVL